MVKPPSWLSKHSKAEWRRAWPELSKRKILTPADIPLFENYCVVVGRVRDLEALIRKDFDLKLVRAQDAAMKTARQLAAEIGLSPISRSRAAMREDDDADSLVD
ncbi:P27 family phage terminase small subunit [Bradyrhizobium semiaridum]|uniref:P27 family phage terminase small subunit n=1 Tax=Bradyrhizobium semiaridum TaxID=2821404 RepID=UPI001CE287EE|nr:P27 family phage terminase small subunit [Bradyrhizobium semiaridum]